MQGRKMEREAVILRSDESQEDPLCMIDSDALK